MNKKQKQNSIFKTLHQVFTFYSVQTFGTIFENSGVVLNKNTRFYESEA